MGMAASQGRYLFLTARNSDIMLELNLCAEQKINLNRESRANAEEYQRGMNAKKFVWTNNQGATKQELSYDLLTSPNTANNKNPYMVTDLQDRVVLNKKLAEIAETLSPSGAPFDWESNRTAILEQLTGIPADRINDAALVEQNVKDAYENMMKLKEAFEKLSDDFSKDITISSFLANLGSEICGNSNIDFSPRSGESWERAYYHGDSINISVGKNTEDDVKIINDIFATINNGLQHLLPGENADLFTKAILDLWDCNNAAGWTGEGRYFTPIKNGTSIAKDGTNDAIHGSDGNWTIDVKKLFTEIFNLYKNKGGDIDTSSGYIKCLDTTSNEYRDYKEAKDAYDAAVAEYNTALSNNEKLMTAEEEQKINYYDALFSTIAEKGWVYNAQINNPEYLNEMLQNNLFTLTTVETVEQFDIKENNYVDKKLFKTDFAANCSKLICVTDTEAQDEARIKYEFKKELINEKETRIDNRMNILQTELQANNAAKEGTKTITDENIERNFKIFA